MRAVLVMWLMRVGVWLLAVADAGWCVVLPGLLA